MRWSAPELGTIWAQTQRLLDHLIGPLQERRRYREAERLRGLQVDDQIELRGLLHRQVPWLGPLQDLVHVRCGASI